MESFTESEYKEYLDLYIKSGSVRQMDRITARTKIPEMAKRLGEEKMIAMYEKARKEIGE